MAQASACALRQQNTPLAPVSQPENHLTCSQGSGSTSGRLRYAMVFIKIYTCVGKPGSL
jgi:hypothetical protein